MHRLSICSGYEPHLSVAQVQLVSQGRVLRLCVRQRGRRSKASSSNPCERCLAQAGSFQPLYKLGWCLQTREACSCAASNHVVRNFESCNVSTHFVSRSAASSAWSRAHAPASTRTCAVISDADPQWHRSAVMPRQSALRAHLVPSRGRARLAAAQRRCRSLHLAAARTCCARQSRDDTPGTCTRPWTPRSRLDRATAPQGLRAAKEPVRGEHGRRSSRFRAHGTASDTSWRHVNER